MFQTEGRALHELRGVTVRGVQVQGAGTAGQGLCVGLTNSLSGCSPPWPWFRPLGPPQNSHQGCACKLLPHPRGERCGVTHGKGPEQKCLPRGLHTVGALVRGSCRLPGSVWIFSFLRLDLGISLCHAVSGKALGSVTAVPHSVLSPARPGASFSHAGDRTQGLELCHSATQLRPLTARPVPLPRLPLSLEASLWLSGLVPSSKPAFCSCPHLSPSRSS